MGSAYIPTQTIVDQYVGTTSNLNPYVILVIDGIAYPNGYRVNYAGAFRIFSGTYQESTGYVYIRCQTFAYGEDIGEFTLLNAQVLIVASPRPAPVGIPAITSTYQDFDDGFYFSSVNVIYIANAIAYNLYRVPKINPNNTPYQLFYSSLSNVSAATMLTFTPGQTITLNIDEYLGISEFRFKIVVVGEDNVEYGIGYYEA